MTDTVSRFEFVHITEGGPAAPAAPSGSAVAGGPGPVPGAAAAGSRSNAPDRPPRASPDPRPDRREESIFGRALEQLRSYGSLAGAGGRAGAELLRPLADLSRLIGDLQRAFTGDRRAQRPSEAPRAAAGARAAGDGASALDGLRIDRAVFHGPYQAVFEVPPSATIILRGGRIVNPDDRHIPTPGRPGPGGDNLPSIIPRPGLPRANGGLPAVPEGPGPIPIFPRAAGAGAAAPGAAGAGAGGAAAAAVGVSAAALTVGLVALTVAVGSAVAAMRALYRRASEQAEQLSAYNATLAKANAAADVARIRQEIQSARTGGNELAKLVEVQSKLSITTTKILDMLQKDFVQRAVPLLEGIAKGAEVAHEAAAYALATQKVLEGIATGSISVFKSLEAIKQIAEYYTKSQPVPGDFFGQFLALENLDINDAEHLQPARTAGGDPVTASGFGPMRMP